MYTVGNGSHGIYAASIGGNATGGSANGGSATGGSANGGNGGSGGDATFNTSGADDTPVVGGYGEDGGTGGTGGTGKAGNGGVGGNATGGDGGTVTVDNSGAITTLGAGSHGIFAISQGGNATGGSADGGSATGGSANGGNGGNGGDAIVTSSNPETHVIASPGSGGSGSDGGAGGDADAGDGGVGGDATGGNGSDVIVRNSGDIHALGAGSHGILVVSTGGTGIGGTADAGVAVAGSADGGRAGAAGTVTEPEAGTVDIDPEPSDGVVGDAGSPGDAAAGDTGVDGTGTNGTGGSVTVENSAKVVGNASGVTTLSTTGTKIDNSGHITALSLLAIDVNGGAADIANRGIVTGYIDLTDEADAFVNEADGTFEARLTSDFRGGTDSFLNEEGATVHTAADAGAYEDVAFIGLESFTNHGDISLVDDQAGDRFTIANTLGGTGLEYTAASGLLVDANLDGPAEGESDIFRIDGNVGGLTHVGVNNVNQTGGAYNEDGITVVEVRGSVSPDAFELQDGPIDAGFFNYDLFYEARGLGDYDRFELRSFAGGGAFLLPQLVTAAQDIWYQTSDTWFDRSADLRTELAGQPQGDGGMAAGLKPGLWVRGSYAHIDRDAEASTSAYGRDYGFDLDRKLRVGDIVIGADLTFDGVMAPADALIVSAFGGYVGGRLDYDGLNKSFDIEGGEIGVAATYLNGGLFVDALFNAQFLNYDLDFVDFDARNFGFRVDTGYRFDAGAFFIEPLATIAYLNSDLDSFTVGANSVSFHEDNGWRGRLGVRAGTSLTAGDMRVEPFAIASLWGNLSGGDHDATLVSAGTPFGFSEGGDDIWGEVSLGANLFKSGDQNTSAFVKGDLSFGDDLFGAGITGGLRVRW